MEKDGRVGINLNILLSDLKACVHVQLLQSCSTFCDPMDCSPPGSSVHGILQARILELVAMSSSRGSSRLGDQAHISYGSRMTGGFFTTEPLGKSLRKNRYVYM